MALTIRERFELDNAIKNHFEDIVALNEFTNQMIFNMIKDELAFSADITSASIVASFNRLYGHSADIVYADTICATRNKVKTYSLYRLEFVLTDVFSKNRNILTFVNEVEGKENITYDFMTGTFSKPIPAYRGGRDGYNYKLRYCYEELSSMLKYEWLFNYTTNLIAIYDIVITLPEEYYKTCPNGYIKFIQETDRELNADTLREYYLKLKYGVVGYNLRNSLGNDIGDWLDENDLTKNFLKCMIENVKSGYFYSRTNIDDCINKWKQAITVKGEKVLLDITKSLKQNQEMFENIINTERNNALARQLQKLNFINGLAYDNLCVVVPQSQDEKKAEGEMQHNCVGYYYDNSIIGGENYIFFIRQLDNVNHSYITCRYNVNSQRVVEYRGFSNHQVTDSEAIYFINEIEKVINANFEKLV